MTPKLTDEQRLALQANPGKPLRIEESIKAEGRRILEHDPRKTAAERFDNGHSCSQAVFTALAEPMGLDYETAVKIASGFGGGMGRMGATCGAVTGALMALGLKYGGIDPDAKEETNRLVNRFADLFRQRHGTLECRDLIACDLSTEEGRQQAHDKDAHGTICTGLVRDAVEIVEQLIGE